MKRSCKIISFLLSLTFCISALPVRAIDLQSESDTGVMLSEADGSFVATEAADADTTVESTAVDGIYVSPEDEYFIQADDTHYLMAQKIEFPLYDTQRVETLLTQHNIAPEIAERIRELSNEALEENNILTSATLYTTAPNTARGYTTSYYTYQGHKMRSDVLSVTGKSPGWSTIQKGSQTKTVANSVANVTLATTGLASFVISVAGAGKSVLDFFTDYYKNFVITGSSEDKLQMKLTYDLDTKWVYGDYSNANDWRLGLTTQRVKVLKYGIYLYFYNDTKGEEVQRMIQTPSSSWYSAASYNNPWAKAWTYIHSPATEYITWKVYNSTIMF